MKLDMAVQHGIDAGVTLTAPVLCACANRGGRRLLRLGAGLRLRTSVRSADV